MATITKQAYDPTQRPVYWFVVLEEALDRGDMDAAAQAQKELARLGVRVQYGRPRNQKGDTHAKASSDALASNTVHEQNVKRQVLIQKDLEMARRCGASDERLRVQTALKGALIRAIEEIKEINFGRLISGRLGESELIDKLLPIVQDALFGTGVDAEHDKATRNRRHAGECVYNSAGQCELCGELCNNPSPQSQQAVPAANRDSSHKHRFLDGKCVYCLWTPLQVQLQECVMIRSSEKVPEPK